LIVLVLFGGVVAITEVLPMPEYVSPFDPGYEVYQEAWQAAMVSSMVFLFSLVISIIALYKVVKTLSKWYVMGERRPAEQAQILLDFSSVKDYMKKGGLEMQAVKCPKCQGPVVIPEYGSQVTCEQCRSTIYATDIFEKVKALIG
jgi:hypothetical protein